MAENVFTEDIQNGIRLAACLVELGTSAMKQVFQRHLNSSHTNLNNILRRNEAKLRKSGFFRLQLELMFPKGKQPCLEEFDVTLMYKLLGILFKVPIPQLDKDGTPLPGDTSENADLYRIKQIRNTIYAHISTMKMSKDQFDKTWNYLEVVLVRLNIPKEDCIKYKDYNLEAQKAEYYTEQMRYIMMQDLESMEAMFMQYQTEFENLFTQQSGMMQHDFKENFDEFKIELQKSMENKDFKFCEIAFQRLAKEIEAQSVIHQSVQNYIEKEITGLGQSVMEVKDTVEKIEQKQSHIEELVMKPATEKVSVLRSISVTNTEYLDELKNDSFKILLTNESNEMNMEEENIKAELELLGKGLGCVPWSLVLDLDHHSRRENGLFDKVTKYLKKHKDFKVATYKKVVALHEDDKENVASDVSALWILANGCPDVKCEPSADKFQKAKIPIMALLTSIVSKLQFGRPVLCVVLLRSTKCVEQVQILLQSLIEIIQAAEENVPEKNCSFLLISLDEKIPPLSLETAAKLTPVCRLSRSISKHLLELFQDSLEEKQFKIPSKSGTVFLTKEEQIPFDPAVEIFHEDMGKIDYKHLGKKTEKVTRDIRLSYHKGNEITAEALFINPKYPVYVERSEIQSLIDKIRMKLEKPNKGDLKHQLMVYHDASGGGSTVARAALYSYRKTFPCILMRQITRNFQQALKKVYDVSRLPLLILFDDVDVSDEEMLSLFQAIENGKIKGLVIQTERFMAIPRNTEKYNTDDSIYVSGTLAEEDKPPFRDLYSKYKKMIRDTDRVFLYGLQAFLSGHKRFTQHIIHCLANITSEQNLLLRFSCMYWHYSESVVPIRLVAKVLKLSPEKVFGKKVLDELGYALDFLIQRDNGLKPAHRCIILPLICIATESESVKDHIRCVLADMASIFDSCLSVEQHEIVTKVVKNIFFKRKHKEENFYAPLIQDIHAWIHPVEIKQTYTEFVKLLDKTRDGPHLRALYARYLMYVDKSPNESVEQMRLSIGLKEDEGVLDSYVNDSSLLITYGNMFRERAIRSSNKKDATVSDLGKFQSDIEESIQAYKKAQRSKMKSENIPSRNPMKINVTSFVGEAKARLLMLEIIFKHKTKSQKKRFKKYLESTTNYFVQSCEYEAMRAIEELEHYRQYDLLYDESPLQTEAVTSKIKFELLYLRSEYPHGGDVQKHIKSMDVQILCDVGLYMRYTSDGLRSWKNFRDSDLEFIISEIKRRLESKRRVKEKCLKRNYEDIITAMIYSSHMSATLEEEAKATQLNEAVSVAKEWQTNFPNDHVPHFMLGLLYFVKGVDEEDGTLFREAEKWRNKCITICEKYKNISDYTAERYFLGHSKGLAKIIPSELDYKELRTFEGRQLKKDKAIVRLCDIVTETKFKPFPDHMSRPQQEQLVYFKLAFAYDGLQAKETKNP